MKSCFSFQYQLLMAEGIMSFYSKNTFTMLLKGKREKTKVHWILQSVGSIFALSGVIIQIISRFRLQKTHFSQAHSIYGNIRQNQKLIQNILIKFIILGLISTIFLFVTLLSGISSLFAPDLRKFISPLLSKFLHNLIALAAFVTGMISIIIAYLTKSWIIRGDPGNVRLWMVVFLSISIVLTLVGPLKSMFFQIENKFFRR